MGNWQMDRILIILKKENGPRASSVPALGINTMTFQHVYWYMQQISGERLQDHWSSVFFNVLCTRRADAQVNSILSKDTEPSNSRSWTRYKH